VVGIVDDPGFQSRQKRHIFVFFKTYRTPFGVHTAFCSKGIEILFPGKSGRVIKLTTYVNLLPKLGMSEEIILDPSSGFMSWRGKNFSFVVFFYFV